MKTTFQTVDVKIPGTSRLFQALMPRPVAPRNIPQEIVESDYRVVTLRNTTTWWKNGTVEREDHEDGNHYTWNPSPTLSEAIRHPPDAAASFRFHASGAIEATMYGGSYYYSPPFDAEQPVIDIAGLQILDGAGEWMWYQLCEGGCGSSSWNCLCLCRWCGEFGGEFGSDCRCLEEMLLGPPPYVKCECGLKSITSMCRTCEELCERCDSIKFKMISCKCYDDIPEPLPDWARGTIDNTGYY